ncbi:MAG: hypothetical protein ING19_05990, partial [Azospirillum sp.]|nr:hypothetical protein [Azospirillum sp.]
GGDILITGNVTSWVTPTVSAPTYAALSGSFDGVAVNAGVSINANGGDIAIAGMGGDTGANQHGVRMYAAAATPTTIATTGAGTITVYGRGGLSTANAGGGLGGSHGGFRFDGDATGVVDISTVNGNIKMVGAGGGVGVTSDNNGGGVFFHTKVRATGSGAIDIAGTPGVGASIGLAAFFAQTEISAVSGDIALTGTSGAAFVNDGAFAGSASGLRIGGATVRTTGTGNVTLRGIDGTEGPGILISDVNGTSTLGNAAMNGDLTLRANSLTYAGTNTITNSGSGRIIFRTDTDATTIGVAGGAGTLQVPTSILSAATGFFNAQIGSISQTGTITAGAGWTLARSTTLLTGTGNVTVASVALAGNQLTFNAGGTVSQTGAISGAGSVYLAGAGNTTLNNGGNSFTDLSFQMTGTAGNVNIATTGALFVGSSTIGTGTLSLTGAGITQSGPLIQDVGGGTVTLIATGGNSITLTNLSNAFRGDVLMTTTGSGNASISHQFIALQLGASSVGGNLTVVSGSTLTQAGALTVGGAANFTAGAATLDLSTNGAANSFGGPVALTNSGGANVLINSSGGLTLGAVSTVGDLIVTAGGSITQSAAISVSGAATLTSSGGNITLSQINSFGGAVTVTGDSISVTGSLTMTGIGNLTLAASGAIGIGVAGSLAATGSGSVWIAAANNIVIDGSITTNGGGITIWGNAPGGSSTAGTAAGTAWGVQINATAMISSAAGAISIVGKGALDNVTGQHGIVLWQGGTVQSTTGDITLLGRGGDGSAGGIGIAVVGGTIQSASGVVSLTGYAGNSGANADGIQLSNGADIHSDSGAMTLTGVGSGSGFGFAAAGTISTIGDPASTGNISLIADTVSMSAATLGIETDGQVLIRPVNAATTIGIGGGAGTLQLPSDMSFVDAGLLVVGDVAAGAIEVGAGGVTVAVGTDLGLRGASIALTGDVTLGPVDTLTLYANTGGVTQAAGSTISAGSLVLRGAGDFAVNRGGTGYNDITNVAADVTAGSGSGAIVIYTGAGGGSSSNALTDGVGTVNGISTPGGLTWVALNGLSQTGAGLVSVGGVANLTAQNGTLDMSVATNSFGGPVAATSAGGGSVLLRGGSLTLGIVNSAGNVILNATSGGINQTGLLTANGNLNASANGGPLALSSYQNVVAGSVSLATSGGKNNIAWTQSGPMLVG